MNNLMVLADIGETFGRGILILIFGLAFLTHMAKKFLGSNPSVGDAAKKAAANKAISLIGRLLK